MKVTKTSFIGKNIVLVIGLILVIVLFLKLDSNQTHKSDDLNSFFKVLGLIDDKYVDETDLPTLTEGAISGVLNKLDPHSIYINKNDYTVTNWLMTN